MPFFALHYTSPSCLFLGYLVRPYLLRSDFLSVHLILLAILISIVSAIVAMTSDNVCNIMTLSLLRTLFTAITWYTSRSLDITSLGVIVRHIRIDLHPCPLFEYISGPCFVKKSGGPIKCTYVREAQIWLAAQNVCTLRRPSRSPQ